MLYFYDDDLHVYTSRRKATKEEQKVIMDARKAILIQLDFDDIVQFKKVEEYISEHNLDKEIVDQAFIQVKYSGYIEKEKSNADKLTRLEDVRIPENFDYDKIKSMSDSEHR